MDGDNDHTPELKVLDAIYGQAEFGIRCEVGTLVRTVADAATALGHASNSETDADSAHIPQGALTMTGHLHLVADVRISDERLYYAGCLYRFVCQLLQIAKQ